MTILAIGRTRPIGPLHYINQEEHLLLIVIGYDGTVAMTLANGLVGTGFTYLYWLSSRGV